MYKVGQEIWFIEFEDDIEDYSCADIACCLYMAGCDNYIIATSMYFGFENDFESQLKICIGNPCVMVEYHYICLIKTLCLLHEKKQKTS